MLESNRSMIVTLLTDFGTADYFVGAMKGVILGRDPRITIVDVTHEVPPQDVRAAAFTLLAGYEAFPAGTVHVAVVDPGVGSARRALAVEAGGHRFVGPDNGLFGWIMDREPGACAFHVTDERVFRHPVSTTFHGRDVFAPVAAALATGVSPWELGPEIGDAIRLHPLRPERGEDGVLRGQVLHVDRFGNCVTSIARGDVPDGFDGRPFTLAIGGAEIGALRRFYAEEVGERDAPFAIWGSAGFLEVGIDRDSAARRLGVRAGDAVALRMEPGP